MRLMIASHVVHYTSGGRIYAYGPYAREIDLWAQLFDVVTIAAPQRIAAPPRDCLAFEQANIAIAPLPEAGGDGIAAKITLVAALPRWAWRLSREMAAADAVHVRCPGNIGLVAALLAPLFSRPMVAKYAGAWMGQPHEPWSYRLQRAILGSRWWRGPVTVYGRWPNQPAHVIPFFTSLLTAEQIERGRTGAARPPASPPRVIYTGRLSASKNVDVLLEALASLRRDGLHLSCTIVGDGPERGRLEALASQLGIGERVHFTGGLAFEDVLASLETHDILVLASNTEGWPKSIAEGMAFGLVCIGSNTGFLLDMLRDGRGVAIPPRDVAALAVTLADIARHPREYEEMRGRALAWAGRYSIDGLREAIRGLLEQHWRTRLTPASTPIRDVSR